MIEVSDEHWASRLGKMPKPEGATLEMMWAALDAIEDMEDREDNLRMLTWYQESKLRYEQKITDWEPRTSEPDYYKKLGLLKSNLALIEEGIEILRERVTE